MRNVIIRFLAIFIPSSKKRKAFRDKYMTVKPDTSSLQKEIISILYKLLDAKWRDNDYAENPNICRRLEFSPKYLREKQAAEETLDYINKNASQAMLFVDREPVLSYCLETFFEQDINTEDLFLEFGVFKGNTINLCSNILKNQKFYGFDSFEGLPEDWSGWTVRKEKFDLNSVYPVVNSNVDLVAGWFDQTLPSFMDQHKNKVAFLHVDCDIYSSTKTIFDTLADYIQPGTIIVFDEYFNYPNWQEHEYKAFQEFVASQKIEYEYVAIGYFQVAVKILKKG